MPERDDEFYVGWAQRAPAGIARFVRARVSALLLLAAALAALLVVSQQDFDDAYFEFGKTRIFEGWIATDPYPQLRVERPGSVDSGPGVSRYLLVGFGKAGAGARVAGLDGRRVRVEGTLVYRDDATMIELVDGPPEVLDGPEPPPGAPESLGRMSFRGEIVDSKCYLGVMKPGRLKPHRACAARCISGGVPPVLLVRDALGNASYLLLAGADGRRLNAELDAWIAEPLRVEGEVLRHDDLLVLRAEPSTFVRLERGSGS